MREPFSCPHPDESVTLRRRTIGPSHVNYGHQCEVCGKLVGNWVKKERVFSPEVLLDWDHSIEPAWREREREYAKEYREQRVAAIGVEAFARDADDRYRAFQSTYSNYLASPEWAEKRQKVLTRANGICEGCAERTATQVHHLTYERVGREMLFDLVALCNVCHKSVHGIDG